jgi:hypothetical protein
MRRALAVSLITAIAAGFAACATEGGGGLEPAGPGSTASGSTSTSGAGGQDFDGGFSFDAQSDGSDLDPDAACAAVVQTADTKLLPVDIIWMVDNSSSMAPAIAEVQAGLNTFASQIGQKSLDYRVIMLSLRSKTSPVQINGSTRYPVCIPPPLAGDANCGNSPQFFQSSIDIRSTQPLEQFLGTLAQTDGYKAGEEKGGEPWASFLRPEATKTIVVVTDDNSRLNVADFEHFAGGKNPFNSLILPPGILEPMWNGLFNGYVFSGIYGWGSAVDPSITCEYPDMTSPPSSGPTYTELVTKTGGVRAQICDGQAAWQPFFDAVAKAVVDTSKLACELDIPEPSMGMIDYGKVNVKIASNNVGELLVFVSDASMCTATGGWYYDNPAKPEKVILCPASCDAAQDAVGPGKQGSIQVLFGCETIVN